MQSTSFQYNAASVFLAIGVLLIMTVPAYAGSAGDNDTEQAATKNGAAVNLYGDGSLMVQAPPHSGKPTTVATTELLDYLVPIPSKARSLTVRQSGGTIFIEAAKPANPQPKMADIQPAAGNPPSKVASHPAKMSPKALASRITRSKEVIVMNEAE